MPLKVMPDNLIWRIALMAKGYWNISGALAIGRDGSLPQAVEPCLEKLNARFFVEILIRMSAKAMLDLLL